MYNDTHMCVYIYKVQRLAETKGDAAVFTAQLNELSQALRRLVAEVREGDRNAVDVAIRTISSRQDENSVALEKFTSSVEKNMKRMQSKLDDVAKEASAPRLLALLKDQTSATVQTAMSKQSEILSKQVRSLEGAKDELTRLPSEASIKRLVNVCMESALAAKDREIRKLQQQVETMREQASLAMRKDEALEQITVKVDSILHNQLGDAIADRDKRRMARQPQTLKSLLGDGSAFETINNNLGSSIVSDAVDNNSAIILSSSLPSLSNLSSTRLVQSAGEEKSYVTGGLQSNGRVAVGLAQPNRWRPIHRKKAHEHMKVKAITSGSSVDPSEPSPWSEPVQNQMTGGNSITVSAPEAFAYQSGREAALKPLGVMESSGIIPSSPMMSVRPRVVVTSSPKKK
jgi:hypothetical protein